MKVNVSSNPEQIKKLNNKMEKLNLQNGDVILVVANRQLTQGLSAFRFVDIVQDVRFLPELKSWTLRLAGDQEHYSNPPNKGCEQFYEIEKLTKDDMVLLINELLTEVAEPAFKAGSWISFRFKC